MIALFFVVLSTTSIQLLDFANLTSQRCSRQTTSIWWRNAGRYIHVVVVVVVVVVLLVVVVVVIIIIIIINSLFHGDNYTNMVIHTNKVSTKIIFTMWPSKWWLTTLKNKKNNAMKKEEINNFVLMVK